MKQLAYGIEMCRSLFLEARVSVIISLSLIIAIVKFPIKRLSEY